MGPSALLVAARYCKERRALLIVDPPSGWQTADDALSGLRDWDFPNENAPMYFPRLLAHDKLRGHFESFAPCGAVAGMLARYDEGAPVWLTADREEPVLRPGFRPASLVGEDRRIRLAALGVNTLQSVRSPGRINMRLRTLAAGNTANADSALLARAAAGVIHLEQHRTGYTLACRREFTRGGCARSDGASACVFRWPA